MKAGRLGLAVPRRSPRRPIRSERSRLRCAYSAHHRGRRSLEQRGLRERAIVAEPVVTADPEMLVLQRMHDLVGKRYLVAGPTAGCRLTTTKRFKRS